jgi:SAM-dependent methyltransferase
LFKKHVNFEVKNILEPACGTGRFLVKLPLYGYHVTGYDNNPKMVDYARQRIADAGLQAMATVMVEDMRSARFDTKFDAAINSINSLGYILSDDDILAHFINMAESIKNEGIYIVHLACALDRKGPHDKEGWILKRNRIRVKTVWNIAKEDRERKLSYQVCKMEIEKQDKLIVLEDYHILRLWIFEDLKSLMHDSGKFKLEAIYDEKYKQISQESHISGELGNLYYVLKVL